jgi:hypothetical protein
MKSRLDPLPNTKSQRPHEITSGVGPRDLGVDTQLSSMRFAAALRLISMTAAALLIGGSTNVFACPMCFGAEETSMVDGTKIGVMVMLAITLAVQGGFAGFFLYLRKRAKRIAEVELEAEWSELQGGSRTS